METVRAPAAQTFDLEQDPNGDPHPTGKHLRDLRGSSRQAHGLPRGLGYDDASAIATLKGFDIHCPACDTVQHIGQTGVWGDREEAIKHMAKVNGTTADEARRSVADAFQVWKRRSGIPWRVDVDPGVLARFPELDCLVGLKGSPGEGRRRISARA